MMVVGLMEEALMMEEALIKFGQRQTSKNLKIKINTGYPA